MGLIVSRSKQFLQYFLQPRIHGGILPEGVLDLSAAVLPEAEHRPSFALVRPLRLVCADHLYSRLQLLGSQRTSGWCHAESRRVLFQLLRMEPCSRSQQW